MRKLKLLLIAVFCLCLFAGGASLVSADTATAAATNDTRYNLLPNGSFEEDISTAQWDYELQWGAKQYTATEENDPGVRTGSRSIRIDCTDGAFDPFAKNTRFVDDGTFTLPFITYGEQYELSMYVKATDGFRGYAFLRVYFNADQGAPVDAQSVYFANDVSGVENEWVKVSYTFTLSKTYGEANTFVSGIRFVFFDANVITPGNLWIDDISLCKAPVTLAEGQVDSVANIDVTETGSAFVPYGFGENAALDTTVAVEGTGGVSLRVNPNGAAAAENLAFVVDRSIFAKDIYYLSFMVKGTDVYRTSNAYPNGLVALPTIMADNNIYAFPESIYYTEYYTNINYRNYVQTYLPGYMTENGAKTTCGVTLPVGEENKTDLDWTEIVVPFNPYGLIDGSINGEQTATYTDDMVNQMGFIIKFGGVYGTLYFDDFKIYRSGTAEPVYTDPGVVDQSAVTLNVPQGMPQIIGYNTAIVFPNITAEGTSVDGVKTDVTENVTVTIQHGDDSAGWNNFGSYVDVDLDTLYAFKAPDHGYFKVIFKVQYAGKTATVEYVMQVDNTLTGVKVAEAYKNITVEKGAEYDFSAIAVNKVLSYSGEQAAAATEYTVDLGDYNKDVAGTYTVTVKMTATYGGTNVEYTDTITVTVVGEDVEVDYTAVQITSLVTEMNIGYGLVVNFPAIKAEATNKAGEKSDVTGTVTFTLERDLGGSNWVVVEGYENVALAEVANFTPDQHGYYRATFNVAYEGLTESVTVNFNVKDTLVDVKVADAYKNITVEKGVGFDFSTIVVNKVLSYTGEQAAAAAEYTVDLGDYNKDAEGTYTITVTMTATYDGSDPVVVTDTMTVIVADKGEEIDHSAAEIVIDYNPEAGPYGVGYQLECALPAVTAKGTAADGTVSDIIDLVKVTVYVGDDTAGWNPLAGYVDLSAAEFKTYTAPQHGYFRVVYTVEYAGKTATAEVFGLVGDTLTGVKVADSYKNITVEKGTEYDFSAIAVKKVLSYSGEQAAAATEYTVDLGDYNKDVAGTYTVTVKMAATYANVTVSFTDTITVTVAENVDYTAVQITAPVTEMNIGYGLVVNFPAVKAEATNKAGEKSDVTGTVTFTLEHDLGNSNWVVVEGYENVALAEVANFTPDQHGYYRATFNVAYEGLTESVTVNFNVQDTLVGVRIDDAFKAITVENGVGFNIKDVVVYKIDSYAPIETVSTDYTVDYGTYDVYVEGTYTITVTMTATYDGSEPVVVTDTMTVTVAPEGVAIDYSAVKLTVDHDATTGPYYVGYQIESVLPTVTAEGTSADGVTSDVTNSVKVTVYHGDDNVGWTEVDGFVNVSVAELQKFNAQEHGWFKFVYTVEYSGKTDTKELSVNVADTLQSISVDTAALIDKIHKGETPNFTNLVVKAVLSYSGETILKADEYTVDFGELTTESDVGEYTLTVIVEQKFADITIRKEATFTIKVVPDGEVIDMTSVLLNVNTDTISVGFKLPAELPVATAEGTDAEGNRLDLTDKITVTLMWGDDIAGWANVVGYVNVPLTALEGFAAPNHGHYKLIYTVENAGKTATATLGINVMDTLQGIRVNLSNLETEIHKGEEVDFGKLNVIRILSYTGESAVAEGNYSLDIGNFNNAVPGEYTITVSYTEVYGGTFETTFTITVKDIVSSFTVTSYPTRTTFSYGEVFDMNGFAGKVVFESTGEKDVAPADVEIRGYSARKVGKQTVTFLYDGVEGGTMEITVLDSFYAVIVDTENVKLTYNEGEALDLTGLVVYKVMVSGIRSEFTSAEYTVDADEFTGKAGTYTITVSAVVDGVPKSAAFEVEVLANQGCVSGIGSGIALISALTLVTSAIFVSKGKKD